MAKQKEIWRDIEGYEGLYQVSNLGRVKSLNYLRTKQERILRLQLYKGYYKVGLSNNGKTKQFWVHRLVAMAFIPNPDNKPCVNHIDGNKENNNVNNLEFVSYNENMKHAYANCLRKAPKGQESCRAKLTNEQAKKIREEYIKWDKNYGMTALAKKYGVSAKNIEYIIHHKTYK